MISFVINLERRKDRLQYVIDTYNNKVTPSQIEIVKAYDGKFESNNTSDYIHNKQEFLNDIEMNKTKCIPYMYNSYNPFKPGELGCWISHLNIWKTIIDRNLGMATIFEDDTIFSEDFNRIFNKIQEEVPTDFNIIWLGGLMGPNIKDSRNKHISENIAIKHTDTQANCAFGYILSKKGATILCNYAKTEFRGNLGVDTFMYEFFTKNNDIQHTVSPFICHSISTIDDTIFKTDIQS